MTNPLQDVRFALRQLGRSRAFTTVAVISLAIGIGSTTTIFTVANTLLLRDRPGIDERGLVDVGRTQGGSGFDNMSYPNYRDYRDASRRVLTGLAAYRSEPEPLSLTTRDTVERIYGQTVSGNYFQVLGARPQAGRFFTQAEDEATDRDLVVVASDRFWRQRFNGSRDVVGRTLVLNGRSFTLVGVARPGFTGPTVLAPDVWVPIHASARASLVASRESVWLLAFGRLVDGASVAQARAVLGAVAVALERSYPAANRGQGVVVLPSSALPGELRMIVGGFVLLLLSLVGLVLLVTCVNVAGLMLARLATRRREIAVRLALGAGRGRLLRQLVTESVLLFAFGGMGGLLLAFWLRGLLVALVPHLPVPVAFDLPFDARVLAFALGLTLAAGLLTGLRPALRASRGSLAQDLKGGVGASGHSSLGSRHALLVVQIALSMVLVVVAGLMVRALQHAGRIDPGFDARNVDVASFDLSLAGLDEPAGRALVTDLLARVRALPAVESASMAVDLPLDGGGFGFGRLKPADRALPEDRPLKADWNIVSPDFFRTMRIRLAAGRPFDERDLAGIRPVAIVNETFARRVWPGERAIGKHLLNDAGDGEVSLEVVGIERDLKYRSLGEAPRPFIYVPLSQRWLSRLTLIVRHAPGAAVMPEIRSIVRALSPALPIVDAQTLVAYTSLGLVPQQIALSVAGSLGLVGLFLVGIGIYGVTAFSVAARTREIGVRVALGADRTDILRLVFRRSTRLGLTGLGAGTVLALAGTQALRGLLFGIGPADPVTYLAAALLFLVATLVATYGPARRAIALDPVAALHNE